MLIQLDFFEQDESKLLQSEIAKVREMTDKVRKGLFARHNELAKMFVELDSRLNVIEMFICRGSDASNVLPTNIRNSG